jgi:four helix bundle protein
MEKKEFFRFRDFPVYKKAREFRKKAKELSKKFPEKERYILTQQLWRALDSIILNIAEGSERYSDLDFSHFLNTAFTSVGESVACFDLAFDDNYISQTELNTISKEGEDLGKQLKSFSAYVRPKKKRFKQ